MLDIYPSRFQQNSLRARSLVSPPSIIKLEPFETIDVRDYLSALAVLSQRLAFPPFVSLSLILPFLPSLAYFSQSSSSAIVPLAIRETAWIRSCECSSNLIYFLSNFPISTMTVLPSSTQQAGSKKQGFIILVTSSPFSSYSTKIYSSLTLSTSIPSCLRKTKALTKSVKILTTFLLQSIWFLRLSSSRQVQKVQVGFSRIAQTQVIIEQRLLDCMVCESTNLTTC